MSPAKQSRLGKGLSALIGEVEGVGLAAPDDTSAPSQSESSRSAVDEFAVADIRPNPAQPRRTFSEAELDELAASIKQRGVLQPILLRPDPDAPNQYQIVAGERRWRAAQRAGLKTIPAVVRDMDELQLLEVGIIENVQREDLNPIEEAEAYGALIKRTVGHLGCEIEIEPGRLIAGNAGVLLRAYVYARMLGRDGMHRVAEYATLNANYLMCRLEEAGFDLAYPERRASHEFIVTLKRLKDETGITAMDVAKRLLDLGFHAPTTYFPLLVPECFLIEPTETESKEALDAFVDAMAAILEEARTEPDRVKEAPFTQPVRRLDDVKAARELDLTWTD